MNFFSPRSAAARYAVGRPFFHPSIIRHIKGYLSLAEPFRRALDIACGTGLSTLALKEIAVDVVGVDASAEMIALAPKDTGISYLLADAERLPFCPGEFDLLTVSQAIHWFDRARFLKEAGRVLKVEGWLIVYDNYFAEEMNENEDFRKWHRESYLKKYPSPPRAWASFTAEDTESEGFHLASQELYRNTIRFSPKGLMDYLVTQSNIIAAVEGGKESIGETRAWLSAQIEPLFGEMNEAGFTFNAPIWYLRSAR